MPSKKFKKAGLGVSVSLLSAILLGSLFAGAIEPIVKSVGDKSDNISVDAAEPYAPVNTNYSAFADGATYQFSDNVKYESFVADDSAQTCVTTITVDRSQPHGSQLNPYVIADLNNWAAFESAMGDSHATDASYTYGQGYFYVLATDIDYQNRTVVPMFAFGGTFYGQGHTIKNFNYAETYNFSNTSTSDYQKLGLWRWTYWRAGSTVIVADLNLEYVYENVNNGVGGFFGFSQADDLEMINCHVKGVVKRMTAKNNYLSVGGLVGGAYEENATSTRTYWACFYQCSAKLEVEMHATWAPSSITVGGIMGESYWHTNTYFADCYAEVFVKSVNPTSTGRTGSCNYLGGILGTTSSGMIGGLKTAMTGGNHTLLRCVARTYADFTADPHVVNWSLGSLMSYYHIVRSSANASKWRTANSTIRIQDCYSYGGVDWINQQTNVRTRCPLPQWYYQTGSTNTSLQHGYGVMNSSGNYFASEKTGVVSTTDYPFNYGTGTNNTTEISDTTNFWNTLKTATASVLKSKVWEHKDHIYSGALRTTCGDTGTFRNTGTFLIEYPDYYDNTTMVNDYNDYCSPVKGNVVRPIFDVDFYDLKKTGSTFSEEKIDVSSVTGYHYKFGEKSPVALAESYNFVKPLDGTRRFVGWTQNRNWTHGTTYDTSFTPPDGMHGNIKYYRIMEATDATATISTQGDKTEAEYGGSITMIANIVCPSISGTSVTYTWKKDGQDASTGTRSTYLINQFDQSGTYSFGYTLTDASMPLVYASGTSTNSVDLTITAKSVKVQTFTVTTQDVFAGMELKDVEFTVSMVDGDNRPVSGTAKWEREIDKVVEGENTANIVFTPDDTSNYTAVTVPVKFTAKAIKLTFTMSQVSSTIEATLNYKQNYSPEMLLQVFQQAFADRLESDSEFAASVSGRAPMLDGKELDDFDTSFDEVSENKSITVTFVTRLYTVTLDKNDGSENATSTRTLSWNNLITPTPEAERNGYELLGWYYTNDAGLEVKWDFEADRVTENLTLTAKWKALNLTLINIDASVARVEAFTALSTVTDDDLTVIATYETDEGETVTNVIHLGGDGYTVTYNGSDREVHYGTTGLYTITVSYRYKGITAASYTTKTDTVDLTVVKIEIDTSKLTFAPKSVEVSQTGELAKANEISATALSALPGNPRVSYEYQRTDGTSDPSWTNGIPATTANIGEYFVFANFTTTSDYNAPAIRTTLKIRAQLIAVLVDWGTFGEATYDSTDKKPNTIRVTRQDTGAEIMLGNGAQEYKVYGSENNETFINAGTHTMTIVLGEDLKFASGQTQSKTLIIKKADVLKPTLGAYSLTYNYGDELSVESFLEGDLSQITLSGQTATTAGDHTLTVSLRDPDNYQWSKSSSSASFTIRWTIDRMSVLAPVLTGDSFEYNGTERSITELFSGNSFDERYMGLELTYRAINASPASGYRARVKLTDTVNYQWESGQVTEFVWRITKAIVAKPSFDASIELDYAGETLNVAELISGYDYTVMKLSSNASQRNAGSYTTQLSLVDTNNYTWDDGTSTAVQVKWVINKLTISPVWESDDTYTQDGGRHSPKIVDFTGLAGTDMFNAASDVTYTGKSNQTAVGSYVTEATLRASWASNYTIDSAEMKKGYRIIPVGDTPDDTDIPIGDPGNSGSSGGNNGGNQGGNQGGNNGGNQGSDGTVGDGSNGSIFASGLPLIQLVISGIALILTIVFVFCTISDAGHCKRAKDKAATLSVSPVLLAPFLGLASTGWWGVAGACVLLCVISLAVMIVFKNKRRAAEGALAEKVAEAKEDAQRRKEDEFKMMMASMMNRPMEAAPAFDVQALLTGMQESMGSMITALLPATAGANANGESETVKLLLAQNSEMMDRLNNQPAPDTSAADERIRELEERMAEQQRLADERLQAERAEALHREEEARKTQQEMLKRQEEMFRQFMERDNTPPTVGGVGTNTTNSFVYEVEEEKLSIDRLTLAEAYEAMNANAKKLFDDLVAYVTSKPETVESDGKYAISFKYRAKALFKLVIKRGIPTMNYSTEGEQLRQIKRDAAASEGLKVRFKLSELQVMDSSTFDVAKEVIKVCMEQIDKDIEFLKEQKAAKRRKPKE